MAVNSSDYVFVTVRNEPAVRVFSKDGRPAGTLGSGLINASAIAVSDTDHVYVLAGSQPGMISIFARDGTLAGTMATGFPDVGGIAIGEDDTVFASDSTGNRFSVYTPSGSFLGTSSGGNLTNPAAIAVSPSGEVFVGDTRNIRVQVFSAVPLRPVPGGTSTPTSIAGNALYDDVKGNGRVDFADVVLYFNQLSWISANEPVAAFDYNDNGRIDFADVVWLFNSL